MLSERVIERGIETLEELKRPSLPPKPRTRLTKKGLAASWDDVDLGPPQTPKRRLGERLAAAIEASHPRGANRSTEFNHEDLKELRKAIKAKDNRRIAQLTAKIGRPSFEDPASAGLRKTDDSLGED